jgi:hypothetical protein
MTLLEEMRIASPARLSRLAGPVAVLSATREKNWDSRPSWDSGPRWDSRPTWDNWSKHN